MGENHRAKKTLIFLNMNIGMLLCFVLTVGLGVSSMSNINKEKNIGAKIERFRRSPGITCSGCLEPTSTSAIVAILLEEEQLEIASVITIPMHVNSNEEDTTFALFVGIVIKDVDINNMI